MPGVRTFRCLLFLIAVLAAIATYGVATLVIIWTRQNAVAAADATFDAAVYICGGISAAIPVVGLVILHLGLFAMCVILRHQHIADVQPKPRLGLWGLAICVLGLALMGLTPILGHKSNAIAVRDLTMADEFTAPANLLILGICIAFVGLMMWGHEYRRIQLIRKESKSADAT